MFYFRKHDLWPPAWLQERTALVVVDPGDDGPPSAVIWNPRVGKWLRCTDQAPAIVRQAREVGHPWAEVDRLAAEEIARRFRTELPSVEELHRVCDEGLAAEQRWNAAVGHQVMLRDERRGADRRYLWASVDEQGRLHIDGQDLGPATELVSSDGEYEWFQTIAAADVPRVVELLGGRPGEDVLQLLERDWTGARSYELEARLRASDIPVELSIWSG